MRRLRALVCERFDNPSGFTVAEILMACALIAIGLSALAAGLLTATIGVETGRLHSTAAFLAEQRIEEIKARALNDFAGATAANYPAEGYGSILNLPNHRRTVVVVDSPGGLANSKRVDVTVFYRPTGGFGGGERPVSMSVFLVSRS